jgi:hypothetical protein
VLGHRGLGAFTGLHTAGYADGTVVVVRGGDRVEQSEAVAGDRAGPSVHAAGTAVLADRQAVLAIA